MAFVAQKVMGDNAPVAFMNVTTDDVINHIDKYGDRAFNYVIVKEHKSVDGVVERVDLAGNGWSFTNYPILGWLNEVKPLLDELDSLCQELFKPQPPKITPEIELLFSELQTRGMGNITIEHVCSVLKTHGTQGFEFTLQGSVRKLDADKTPYIEERYSSPCGDLLFFINPSGREHISQRKLDIKNQLLDITGLAYKAARSIAAPPSRYP